MGMQGTAEVSVDAPETNTVYVVAKLVNVPGAVNTNDVQSHFDLNMDYTAPALPPFSVGGSRSDDRSVYTQGQTNTVQITVSDLPDGVREVSVTDFVPAGWEVLPFGNAEATSDGERAYASTSGPSRGPTSTTGPARCGTSWRPRAAPGSTCSALRRRPSRPATSRHSAPTQRRSGGPIPTRFSASTRTRPRAAGQSRPRHGNTF